MFNNQNYNNGENNEGVYMNDNRLQRVGLYISDTFDQSSSDTIDLTEDDYSSNESVQSHIVKTRIVPVRTFTTQKPAAVLSNGYNSIKIISNNDIGQNLIQQNINVDGTHRSVFLMNDKMKMLARRKCLLQTDGRQKIDNDEYHAVIVHEPEAKIPRPPNAFMIFANEWRKKVAHKYNNESNKDISVRLGHMWRSLEKTRKEEYFVMARKADAEHKMKYPDYVYNPKEARLRKALRDSWKDKGRRTPNGQFRSIVGKPPTNWSASQIAQNRTLLPMPRLSNMTFSMAADGYSMMETPAWSNSWYPYRHNPVPYLVPQFTESYNGDSNDNYSDRMYHQQQINMQEPGARNDIIGPSPSPFADHNEPVESEKGPLSQLQELTNVFSSPNACARNAENEAKQEIATTENEIMKFSNVTPNVEVESTTFNNDSDSGYVTDHPHPKEAVSEIDYNKNVSKTGVSDVLMTENNGESFMESYEGNGQSNYINVDDVFLDCNFLTGEKNFGSGSSLEMQDQGKNVLPGFQQAFGSTEIGRFSRNDFFTNPPPETADKKQGKQPKQEPLDYPWNPIPNPSNYPTTSNEVDYFSELCDIEEGLLDSHAMLNADPILIHSEESSSNSGSRKFRGDRIAVPKKCQSESHPGGGYRGGGRGGGGSASYKGDEFLDVLSTVADDIDDFNVDELLKEESDKFNLSGRNRCSE